MRLNWKTIGKVAISTLIEGLENVFSKILK